MTHHERHPVGDLRTFHTNPKHGDVEAIAESLRINGQYRPIVVNRGTYTNRPMEVLAGNHTLMAHRLLCERHGGETWGEIDCWVIDVDDDQASRIVLADNRTADLGMYDNDILLELLGSLDDEIGLDGTGYTEDYVNALLGGNEMQELPDDCMCPDAPRFQVVVECKNIGEQQLLAEELRRDGYTVHLEG